MDDGTLKSVAVGIVAAVALAAIAFGVFLIGNTQKLWEGRTTYRIHFTRTNGLQEGSPVALDGVNVGSVTKMQFPNEPSAQYIEVTLSVSSAVANRIRRDTLGKIQTLGLLGDKYIELRSGSLQAEPVGTGGLIRSLDPVDYEAILGQSGDIVSNAIEVTALLRQVLTDINNGEGLIGHLISDRDLGHKFADNLNDTVANLESATHRMDDLLDRIQRGQGALGKLTARDQQVDEIFNNMRTASEEAATFAARLNHGKGTLARLTADEQFADQTLGNIEKASSSIAEIAQQVRSGRGTVGKLIYDEKVYNEAESFLGGGTGGFWKMLGRGLAFFWPFPSKPATERKPTAAEH